MSNPYSDYLHQVRHFLPADGPAPLVPQGRLVRMVGLTLEAVGTQAVVGERCRVVTRTGKHVDAEVVGFANNTLYLMPIGEVHGLGLGARIIPTGQMTGLPVSEQLLGRVIDGAGRPLDGLPPIRSETVIPLDGVRLNPLKRDPVHQSMDVGLAAINSVLTIGQGQRVGLFAGSGVGKSVTLGMMTRYAKADIVVVGLIGERGREVKEFLDEILGPEGRARSVIVAAPADSPPLARLHGCLISTAIAEYFRDQGAQVLLLMDSLTRFAQAQREIALAIGEPPATKGYPPSVFARLPHLVERAGNGCAGDGQGGITAFYTVLMEGDDQQDPISDAARAILDGHIVLSRELAGAGHYPAIDISSSVSRVMTAVATPRHQKLAQQLRHYYGLYNQNKDLISIGAYAAGSDPEVDKAIALMPSIKQILTQGVDECREMSGCIEQMAHLFDAPPPAMVAEDE